MELAGNFLKFRNKISFFFQISTSDFFARCIDNLLPDGLETFDILFAEHTANDEHARFNRIFMAPSSKKHKQSKDNENFPEFTKDPGQSLEQFLRVVLSKNNNLVIVIPEIMIRIFYRLPGGKFEMPVCSEYDNGFKINEQLAKFYQLAAVIKFNHVPCSENISQLDNATLHLLVEKYQSKLGKKKKLDFHPSAMVHGMMAEFILYYFSKSLMDFNLFSKPRPSTTALVIPNATFYNNSQYFDKDFSFQCFTDIQEPNLKKNEVRRGLVSAPHSVHRITDGEFHFKLNETLPTQKCGSRGFEITLSIAYKLCKCKKSEAIVDVLFWFSNGFGSEISIGPVRYLLPLLAIGYSPVVVEKLVPQNATQKLVSWTPKLKLTAINVTLSSPPSNTTDYPINLYAFIIQYQCDLYHGKRTLDTT